jgi:hypothetical protein
MSNHIANRRNCVAVMTTKIIDRAVMGGTTRSRNQTIKKRIIRIGVTRPNKNPEKA